MVSDQCVWTPHLSDLPDNCQLSRIHFYHHVRSCPSGSGLQVWPSRDPQGCSEGCQPGLGSPVKAWVEKDLLLNSCGCRQDSAPCTWLEREGERQRQGNTEAERPCWLLPGAVAACPILTSPCPCLRHHKPARQKGSARKTQSLSYVT